MYFFWLIIEFCFVVKGYLICLWVFKCWEEENLRKVGFEDGSMICWLLFFFWMGEYFKLSMFLRWWIIVGMFFEIIF